MLPHLKTGRLHSLRVTSLCRWSSRINGETVKALARTAGFLRSALSHRLDLYSVPQLHFFYDDSIEAGMRLSQLLDDAVAADKKLAE